MKTRSAIAVIIIFMFIMRLFYSPLNSKEVKPTTFDALGYYIYLPALFVYEDVRDLAWFSDIDKSYKVSGGQFYQADKIENGNYVAKYYGGVAFMTSPFFLGGHLLAPKLGYPQDGFSAPYQWSIAIASLFYSIMALILLSSLLKLYYSDEVSAIILLLTVLATNIPQYMVVDCGQTHSYLFFLYVSILYLSHLWHRGPTLLLSFLIGANIGLATFVRPTEIVMILIPLLWKFEKSIKPKSKIDYFKLNPKHILVSILGGFLLLLPQIIYWQYTAGTFIYDVGSKWVFLNPFFRVLFGFEKGWFIYTPVTIFFITSLYHARDKVFAKSAIWFSLINIWIIISWFDWRYGGSYSTRALSQSYPVFALCLGALISHFKSMRIRSIIYVVSGYLILVNLIQLYQYNETIIHYDHMNRAYYQKIYLDLNPDAIEYSLLDTDDWNSTNQNEWEFIREKRTVHTDTILKIPNINHSEISVLKTLTVLEVGHAIWDGQIVCSFSQYGEVIKQQKIRLNRPKAKAFEENSYGLFSHVPEECQTCLYEVSIESDSEADIRCEQIEVYGLKKLG